ncbi:hypothetical protein ARMSODRAFT_982617 [Armillaria solidipes]|uniref:Uncharacterized protein n=1 Tax=Armillaria solidipes TaxID=1076256 RepID=A0A2H3B889_9AGAR|nr:hypothetical protein ARMSODRAFT_982617 [Armillaria solidipes]
MSSVPKPTARNKASTTPAKVTSAPAVRKNTGASTTAASKRQTTVRPPMENTPPGGPGAQHGLNKQPAKCSCGPVAGKSAPLQRCRQLSNDLKWKCSAYSEQAELLKEKKVHQDLQQNMVQHEEAQAISTEPDSEDGQAALARMEARCPTEELAQEQSSNAELQKKLDEIVKSGGTSTDTEGPTIPRPKGVAGTYFSIQVEMKLTMTLEKTLKYKAIQICQQGIRFLTLNMNINWKVTWAKILALAKANFFTAAREKHKYLKRFKNDWATELAKIHSAPRIKKAKIIMEKHQAMRACKAAKKRPVTTSEDTGEGANTQDAEADTEEIQQEDPMDVDMDASGEADFEEGSSTGGGDVDEEMSGGEE